MYVEAFEDPENPDVISFEFDMTDPEDVLLRNRFHLIESVAEGSEYSPLGSYMIATMEIRQSVNILCDAIIDLHWSTAGEGENKSLMDVANRSMTRPEDQGLLDALTAALRASVARMSILMGRKLAADDLGHLEDVAPG